MGLVKPKKFLGQHFLRDLGIANDIADTVDACPDLPVLEVGPGMGVLTQFLMKKAREVKLVELDFESVAYLKENFAALEEYLLVSVSKELSKYILPVSTRLPLSDTVR